MAGCHGFELSHLCRKSWLTKADFSRCQAISGKICFQAWNRHEKENKITRLRSPLPPLQCETLDIKQCMSKWQDKGPWMSPCQRNWVQSKRGIKCQLGGHLSNNIWFLDQGLFPCSHETIILLEPRNSFSVSVEDWFRELISWSDFSPLGVSLKGFRLSQTPYTDFHSIVDSKHTELSIQKLTTKVSALIRLELMPNNNRKNKQLTVCLHWASIFDHFSLCFKTLLNGESVLFLRLTIEITCYAQQAKNKGNMMMLFDV